MGTYTGTDANEVITPTTVSASVTATPGGSRPGAAPDILVGNGGNDLLDGGTGADTLAGGVGSDTYVVNDEGDAVTEGDTTADGGVDLVRSSITYTLGAGLENLTLQGSASINGTGNDLDNILRGNSDDNLLNGAAGVDTLIGRGGIDRLLGGRGDDTLNGGGAADLLNGGAGADFLNGSGGDDLLRGGSGDDTLEGSVGADTLRGVQGDDKLDGGKGVDTLAGGAGDDEFIFAKANQGGDRIRDFRDRDGNSDTIVIESAGFRGGLEAGDLSDDQFQVSEGNEAEDADVRFIFDTSDNSLWFDRNGDGAGGLKLIADLQASARLEADDFLLV